MLLLVDDRSIDPQLAPIKEHLMDNIFPEIFSLMLGHDNLTILSSSKNGMKLIRGGGSDTLNCIVDPSEGFLRLLDLDTDDFCIIMKRIAFFAEGFSEIFRFHSTSCSDVTVVVKEMSALPGMYGVSLDHESNLLYRKKEDPVRSKSMDMNIYVLKKDLIREVIQSDIDVDELEVSSLPLFKDNLKMRGYRLRSKVGFTNDLVSLLETQRMAMDSFISKIQKITSKNIDLGNEQILNMPVYINKRVQIGKKCRIGPYVTILDDVRIGDDVFILNSIIGKGCIIEDDVYLEGAVIGPGNVIRKGSEIEWNAV